MFHCMLVLFRWPAEAFFAVVAAMGVVFGVDGDDVTLKTRSVRGIVFTVLTLVNFLTTMCFHVLLQFSLLPKALTAAFAPKW